MSYAPVSEYRQALDKVRTDDDAGIFRDLGGASDTIEQICNRTFGPRYAAAADTSTAPRTATDQAVYGRGTRYLRLRLPMHGTLALTDADGDVVDADTYREVNTDDGLSVFMFKRTDGGVWAEDAAYSVNGMLGTAETPPAIVRATIELAAIDRLESPRAFNIFTEFGSEERRVTTMANKWALLGKGLNQYALIRA